MAPLHTYSWAFKTLTQCDERETSDRVVEGYGFPSTTVDAEAEPLLSFDPYVGPDRDSPYVGGFHGLEEQCLRIANQEGLHRMLTGQRGDLVTGGWLFDYLRLVKGGRWRELWNVLNAHMKHTGVPLHRTVDIYLLRPFLANLWPDGHAEALRRPLRRVYRTLRPGNSPKSPFPPWIRSGFAERHTPLPDPPNTPDDIQNHARRSRYRQLLMPTQIRVATAAERRAAQHEISTADPWSDRRLVEFAFAVPPSVLCRKGQNKWLVKESMEHIMPESARKNAEKVNPCPLHRRELEDRLFALARDVITRHPFMEAAVDPAVFRKCCRSYENGDREDHRFWYTLTLGLWLQRHVSAASG